MKKNQQQNLFYIMARINNGNWAMIKSLDKPILFLTKEEAERYMNRWRDRKYPGCQAFVAAGTDLF